MVEGNSVNNNPVDCSSRVGAERSYQLSYQRLFEPDQELDERQRKRMPFAVPRCLEDESAEHTLG